MKIPRYPILDNIRFPFVRALIAVGIGCDVHLSGVPHVTPKTIHEFLLEPKTNNAMFDDMIEYMIDEQEKIIIS